MRKLSVRSKQLSIVLTAVLIFENANVYALGGVEGRVSSTFHSIPFHSETGEFFDTDNLVTDYVNDDGDVGTDESATGNNQIDEEGDEYVDSGESANDGSAAPPSEPPPVADPLQLEFNSYSLHTRVQDMIAAAREHIRLDPDRYKETVRYRYRGRWRTRTIAYCYRAVKDAMRASGMVPEDFGGSGVARDAETDLKNSTYGFRDLLEDPLYREILRNNPRMAPKGSLLVYRTADGAPRRISRAGHVEIKTQDSGIHGYISISERNEPTYGYQVPRHRQLIGVLIKDDP